MGDAGFLGSQRIDEIKIWLSLLKSTDEFSQTQSEQNRITFKHLLLIPGGMKVFFLWENCLKKQIQLEDPICCERQKESLKDHWREKRKVLLKQKLFLSITAVSFYLLCLFSFTLKLGGEKLKKQANPGFKSTMQLLKSSPKYFNSDNSQEWFQMTHPQMLDYQFTNAIIIKVPFLRPTLFS